MVLDESTHDYMGPEAAEGLWASFAYFQDMRSTKNDEFLQRYRDRFGPAAAPVSSLSESLYEGIHMVALAARACKSTDQRAIKQRMRAGIGYNAPRGKVRASWQGVRQTMFIAQSRSGILSPVGDLICYQRLMAGEQHAQERLTAIDYRANSHLRIRRSEHHSPVGIRRSPLWAL